MDEFFDLYKDDQVEIPTNVIVEILRDYAYRLDKMRTLFAFILGLLLFLCAFAVQANDFEPIPQEGIPEAAPSPDQISDDAIRYLQGEDMYQSTLSWQGNKASIRFNYEIKKEKR